MRRATTATQWVSGWGGGGAAPPDEDLGRSAQVGPTSGDHRLPAARVLRFARDVFDNEVEQGWRDDLWGLLRATPNLRWMVLTKRIGNAARMLPADWPYPHVGLMSTLENQEIWDRD